MCERRLGGSEQEQQCLSRPAPGNTRRRFENADPGQRDVQGLEPGPEFQEEPLASCDQHARKIQGSPGIAKGASLLKVKHSGRVWGRSVSTEPRIAWPEGPAPPELTRHGEGGQEGSLNWLRLRGWRWGRRLLLLLPLRVLRVFHGDIPVFDVFVSPVLKWLAAHTVRRVDQSLPLCGQGA